MHRLSKKETGGDGEESLFERFGVLRKKNIPASDSLREGYVITGRYRPNPKIRKVVLKADSLLFLKYKTEALVSSHPLGTVITVEPHKGSKKCFDVHLAKGTKGKISRTVLECPNQQHRDAWVAAIRKACAENTGEPKPMVHPALTRHKRSNSDPPTPDLGRRRPSRPTNDASAASSSLVTATQAESDYEDDDFDDGEDSSYEDDDDDDFAPRGPSSATSSSSAVASTSTTAPASTNPFDDIFKLAPPVSNSSNNNNNNKGRSKSIDTRPRHHTTTAALSPYKGVTATNYASSPSSPFDGGSNHNASSATNSGSFGYGYGASLFDIPVPDRSQLSSFASVPTFPSFSSSTSSASAAMSASSPSLQVQPPSSTPASSSPSSPLPPSSLSAASASSAVQVLVSTRSHPQKGLELAKEIAVVSGISSTSPASTSSTSAYEQNVEAARKAAQVSLAKAASKLGANAVLAAGFSITGNANGGVTVMAYGTACVLTPTAASFSG
ncbi:hypothetical protein QOT17_021007 [Balamuthia mandrillaris]